MIGSVLAWVAKTAIVVFPILSTVSQLFSKTSSPVSAEIAKLPAIPEGSETVASIMAINMAFHDMLAGAQLPLSKIEDEIMATIACAVEDFIAYAQEHVDTLQASKFRHKLEQSQQNIKGVLNRAIQSEISPNNFRCREILTLPAGAHKKAVMDSFIQQAFAKTMELVVTQVEAEMLALTEYIKTELAENLAIATTNSQDHAVACKKLSAANTQATFDVVVSAGTKIALADWLIDANAEVDAAVFTYTDTT